MDNLKTGTDAMFILLGAIMVLAMHAGFAFLELGTVRKKNQVNALVKILVDFAVSTISYFFIGYTVAYGVQFMSGADVLAQKSGYELVKFFFLATFAAAIPAIISGGIAERSRFNPQLAATFVLVGFVYPFFEGIAWNNRFGIQDWIASVTGAPFHDFAGSVVVHAVGGWIALPAVLLLGARRGRYQKDGRISAHPPSNIPFLALGAWVLAVGWFGFNVMSAQTVDKISGLVAINSLMAMAGGTLAAWWAGRNDPGFAYNGPLAGLVAVCAGSDLMHPLGALITGAVAACCSFICLRWRRTSGTSTTCSVSGPCTACAAPGAASPRASSAATRSAASAASRSWPSYRHGHGDRDCPGGRHRGLRHAEEGRRHSPGR
jgi:Amt family ammonium transporter